MINYYPMCVYVPLYKFNVSKARDGMEGIGGTKKCILYIGFDVIVGNFEGVFARGVLENGTFFRVCWSFEISLESELAN